MKKLTVVIAIVVMSYLLSGCMQESTNAPPNQSTYENGDTILLRSEDIERSTLDAEILYQQYYYGGNWSNFTAISYEKHGETYYGAFMPEIVASLDWLYNNAEENATILCWWDYGSMVEGYAERNVITTFASENLEETIASYSHMSEEKKQEDIAKHGGWAPEEYLQDIASVFTCSNISANETKAIIETYNVSYIFTRGYDEQIAFIFFKYFDKDTADYIDDYNLTDLAKQSLIFQMWSDDAVPYGLELVHHLSSPELWETFHVKIFKIVL
ncbi:MAG: hypothetical protein JW771_00150 [Candidatus Thermoplasmatota archaeon]|nr:hypothetical protein [Candidatus Thermoplasmatota archaeon]